MLRTMLSVTLTVLRGASTRYSICIAYIIKPSFIELKGTGADYDLETNVSSNNVNEAAPAHRRVSASPVSVLWIPNFQHQHSFVR